MVLGFGDAAAYVETPGSETSSAVGMSIGHSADTISTLSALELTAGSCSSHTLMMSACNSCDCFVPGKDFCHIPVMLTATPVESLSV